MISTELITVLYRKVCLQETLTPPEQLALHDWIRQSDGTAQVYHRLADHPDRHVQFGGRHRFVVLLVWCLISLVVGISIGMIPRHEMSRQGREQGDHESSRQQAIPDTRQNAMAGKRHPYAVTLTDSVWQMIHTYAAERDLKVSWNELGKLTFSIPPDRNVMNVPPLFSKRIADSIARAVAMELIQDSRSFLAMVVTTIAVRMDYQADAMTGFSDYEGMFNYDVMRFFDNTPFKPAQAR